MLLVIAFCIIDVIVNCGRVGVGLFDICVLPSRILLLNLFSHAALFVYDCIDNV